MDKNSYNPTHIALDFNIYFRGYIAVTLDSDVARPACANVLDRGIHSGKCHAEHMVEIDHSARLPHDNERRAQPQGRSGCSDATSIAGVNRSRQPRCPLRP
jgi:hypothetical protein